jgi:hypothetical protein
VLRRALRVAGFAGMKGGFSRLPRGVWALGITSLLMDTSSELIHSLLPVFLATVLGASMTTIGILEGAKPRR